MRSWNWRCFCFPWAAGESSAMASTESAAAVKARFTSRDPMPDTPMMRPARHSAPRPESEGIPTTPRENWNGHETWRSMGEGRRPTSGIHDGWNTAG